MEGGSSTDGEGGAEGGVPTSGVSSISPASGVVWEMEGE